MGGLDSVLLVKQLQHDLVGRGAAAKFQLAGRRRAAATRSATTLRYGELASTTRAIRKGAIGATGGKVLDRVVGRFLKTAALIVMGELLATNRV